MTIDVSTGTATSESYVSVADAEAYAADHGLAFSGEVADQEAALRRATSWVDATYRGKFPGQRVNGRSQALEWPRSYAKDAAGNDVDSATIPAEIQSATIEAAVRELATPSSLSPDVVPGQIKTLTAVEGIQWEANPSGVGADGQKPVLTVIDGILSGLLSSGNGMLLRA